MAKCFPTARCGGGMSQADVAAQLLLKLRTGHGPFTVRYTRNFSWHRWEDDFEHVAKHYHKCDAAADPLIVKCKCHGMHFCEHCGEHLFAGLDGSKPSTLDRDYV